MRSPILPVESLETATFLRPAELQVWVPVIRAVTCSRLRSPGLSLAQRGKRYRSQAEDFLSPWAQPEIRSPLSAHARPKSQAFAERHFLA